MARTVTWLGVLVLIAPLLGGAQGSVSFYLRGTGANNNPPTLFLDTSAPVESTAKFRDSAGLNFNGGNPWKEVGAWSASPGLTGGTLAALGTVRVWLGLKNSDDQGTNFDLRGEVLRNGMLVAAGETYCITGITRNPNNAKEVEVAFGSFTPPNFDGTTDALTLKVFARIGTDGAGGFCGGHSNAVGLRLYFDAVTRPASLNASFAPPGGGEPPVVHLDDQVEVATSTRVTLASESHDPGSLPLTFAWTQLQGPTVALEGANTPNVGFISPAEDAELVLRLTVSNGLASASRDVTVGVIGFATDLGLQPGSGEGHTSALEVTSTSLRPGFIWGHTDTALEVSLFAADGAVLVDVIDPIEPFGVLLLHASGAEDVTEMFRYSPGDNQVSLDPTRVADFRALLKDEPMQLLITGGDSAGNGAELYVPLFNGRFQILGTATLAAGATPEPLAGTLVTLRGMNLGFTSTTTMDSSGGFVFGNLLADTYVLDVVTAGGLVGVAFVDLREGVADTVDVSLVLFDASATSVTSEEPLSSAGAMSAPASGLQASTLNETAPSHALPYAGIVGAVPSTGTFASQATIALPQGTESVSLAYKIGSGFSDEDPFFDPRHPCNQRFVFAGSWYFLFVLNGQVVWAGNNGYCNTALRPFDHETDWFNRNLDVSVATREADAELRLIVGSGAGRQLGPGIKIAGPAISADALVGTDFAVTSVVDRDAFDVAPVLSEPVCGPFPTKLIGVPPPNRSTANHWDLKIAFEPAEARILDAKVFAQAPLISGILLTETLEFDPLTEEEKENANGLLRLRNVGFQNVASRELWESKATEMRLLVRVEAELPDGTVVSRREFLGKDAALKRRQQVLTPLYDAGAVVGPEQRYGVQNDVDPVGQDAWGTLGTFNFLTAFEFSPTDGDPTPEKLVFNDISLEHGGPFPTDLDPLTFHARHQCGASIDSRYFGDGGKNNALNGRGGDVDINRNETGRARRDRLEQARQGDTDAQRDIVNWIFTNRKRIDQLAMDGNVAWVGVGNASWNIHSLVNGKYEDPSGNLSDIINPDNGQSVGCCVESTEPNQLCGIPAVLKELRGHLNHVHIERNR